MPTILETTDAANSISTTAEMEVGDFFHGTLATTGDSDWIAVELVAGETYTFAAAGIGALNDSLSDPYLRLRDASGNQIAFDDDGGPGRMSDLTITATTTGTYYVDIQSWNNSQAGDYGLSVTEGNRANFDIAMGTGILIRSDSSWSPTPETPVEVTWSIRTSGTEPDGGSAFIAPSAAQVAAIEHAMAYIGGISGLTLTQVNPGGTSNDATIVFGSYFLNDGGGAYAYFPGSTASGSNAGDVWLNNQQGSTTSLPIGSYSYFTIIHEIGHAIGLSHPGDYNAAPGVSITYGNNAQFTEDSHQYTVMSYFDEGNTGSSVGGYPDTLMLFDLYAIHQQYGADMTFHAGDTTYGFNATVGGAYDFTVNTNPLLSIWDGAGTDTIDLSGYSGGQNLTLVAGELSSVGGYDGNLSIAIGAEIENAVGGSGNDTITGNAGNNNITGGSGNDSIRGSTGNDTLNGGIGNDTLRSGSDDDEINGGSGDDSIRAGSGEDLINAGTGMDDIEGGSGNDTINGDGNADYMRGGTGNDLIDGGSGGDTIRAGSGDDTIDGGTGDDSIRGGIGDDFIEAGTGADSIDGGTGSDTIYGGTEADTFIFDGIADSTDDTGRDVIEDFVAGEDFIDLSEIGGLTFVGNGPFSGTGGEVSVTGPNSIGRVKIFIDVDGDGTADMKIVLNDTTALTAADFIL